MSGNSPWPDLPLAAWSDTCDTLQLWTQIVGKVRIALTPLVNHWWNATLIVTARGLAAPAMPYAGRMFDIIFDFADHRLVIETSDCRVESFALEPMAVADFYGEFMQHLRRLGIDVHIRTMPCEIENAVPFDRDRTHAQYDPVYAQKFWLALVQANRVMNAFRARFIGKASPVHFFWGSFDLAVTRFSGRIAQPPKGVTPHVASWVMAEAYSHECSSCGFWPGNGGYGRAAFYVYAYPEPAGYGDTRLQTAEAFYDKGLGQFILPYDAVRQARDPDMLLLGFLFEGAQGTFLDIDHGTYPFVTSSNTTAGGACTGSGVPPHRMDRVVGVMKAYTTRVGEGPLPTENAAIADMLHAMGREFGATTGRPRRCGWFDSVATRHAAMVNGIDDLAVTNLDGLDKLETIKVCVAYRHGQARWDFVPNDAQTLAECEPVYVEFEGWRTPTHRARSWKQLPVKARTYLKAIAELSGAKLFIASVGPAREETIFV